MSTLKVTDQSFETDVLGSAVPVVVDFWAEWCGPCKMIGPSLEEIAKEFDGKVKIAKVNVDENPGIAGQLGIRSIPTLMLYKDGKMTSQKVGAAPKGELKKVDRRRGLTHRPHAPALERADWRHAQGWSLGGGPTPIFILKTETG